MYCIGDYLYAGTKHRNLHQLSGTMSRVTYFILRAHTGTGFNHSQHRKNSGEVLEKLQVSGLEGLKLARKKFLVVSVACVATY